MNKEKYADPTADKAIAHVMKEQKAKMRRALSHMELSDTVELMTSSDYKDRFKAEYYQLRIRYTRLKNMVDRWDYLDFKPKCSRQFYTIQLSAMRSYLTIMEHRAKAEGVELNDII